MAGFQLTILAIVPEIWPVPLVSQIIIADVTPPVIRRSPDEPLPFVL